MEIREENKDGFQLAIKDIKNGDNLIEIETAIREVKEETNLDVEIDVNKKYKMEYVTDKGKLKQEVLTIKQPGQQKMSPEFKEILLKENKDINTKSSFQENYGW